MNPSVIDLATRVHNHNFRIDPIVRSLLDTDFYKFLMQQFIWEQDYRDISVTFTVTNRTRTARLAEQIDESELRAQLDHVRELRFSRSELVWLQGNTFYGTRGIFSPNFIEWLGRFRLPEYELRRTDDGQLELRFAGPWAEVTLWEIPALAIINELRARRAMRSLSRLQLDILYARAKTRLWSKIERLRRLQLLNISDFGTRRRHGFLWQEWAVVAMRDALGPALSGTSNAHLAMKHDLEAIGTNAHELQMVVAALAASDQELAGSPYEVLRRWAQTYHGALLVLLPDTYGTTSFLARAPEWVAEWTGARVDSKEPVEGGEEMIAWWRSRGQDPREKLLLFSDGLDIDAIEMLHARFSGQVRLGFGWGTLLTNDFRGCQPSATALPGLEPISIVCKVTQAGGRPVVKLSDNLRKATGPAAEIERYLRVFGSPGGTEREVVV